MNQDQFSRQIEVMSQRVAELYECISESPLQKELLPEAFEKLQITLEELRVAEEELRVQNEELVTAHQAVKVERQRYQDLFEFAPDGYLVTDVAGVIWEVNRAAATLLNVSQQFLVGKPLAVFVVKEARRAFRAQLNRLGQTNQVQEWEVSLQSRNSKPFDAVLTVAVVHDQEGKPIVLRWLLHDITQRKRMEAEIRNALQKEKELSELKSRFIATTSHEFRTPLTVILNSVQLLERYGYKLSEEEKLKHLHRVQEAGKNMAQLVDDLLVMSRAEAGKQQCNLTPLDLVKFCGDLVEEMQLSTDIKHTITFLSQGKCINACMDEKLLWHILDNLLSNAVKYSPEDSTVHFELACQDGKAIFQIQDEGIGIPLEDQQRLFETFHRGSNAGTIPGIGLGLAIVKKFVDLHGGKIAVKSEVGVGTTFTTTISLGN